MRAADPLAGLSRSSDQRPVQARAIKDLVRKALDLDADTAVFVAEITCGEIDCPDRETVIAVFQDGARKEYRVPKSVSEITGADLSAAISRNGNPT